MTNLNATSLQDANIAFGRQEKGGPCDKAERLQ